MKNCRPASGGLLNGSAAWTAAAASGVVSSTLTDHCKPAGWPCWRSGMGDVRDEPRGPDVDGGAVDPDCDGKVRSGMETLEPREESAVVVGPVATNAFP